jgi:hypothetical protein
MNPTRPLLFLDVDGPILPIGGSPTEYGFQDGANPLLSRINPALGPLLLELGCQLMWATTWTDDANVLVCPILGLPELPVVTWPDPPDDGVDTWFGLHWKTRPLVDHANGRAFIWVDDEITEADRIWVSEHHPGQALLHRVDPSLGLSIRDLNDLTQWIGALPENHPKNGT